jgi:hypothetical protein
MQQSPDHTDDIRLIEGSLQVMMVICLLYKLQRPNDASSNVVSSRSASKLPFRGGSLIRPDRPNEARNAGNLIGTYVKPRST